MGKVAMVYNVMLDDMDRMDEVKSNIEKMEGWLRSEIEEVGMGIKTLKVTFVRDETDGVSDALENELRNVDGVMEIDMLEMSRI